MVSFKNFGAIALAAALAPFVFFALLILMSVGVIAFSLGPILWAFIGWIFVNRMQNRAKREKSSDDVLEARIVREEPRYSAEAYTPPMHFDLLLSGMHDIGRMRGSANALTDSAVAEQIRAIANRADGILALVKAQPAKLSLARQFFASYLPRAADLADGAHRISTKGGVDPARRAKLIDVLYRLDEAMKQSEAGMNSPELSRLDADMKILQEDLSHIPTPQR